MSLVWLVQWGKPSEAYASLTYAASVNITFRLKFFTGCAVAQPCVNDDWLCQWESAIFDPLHNRHPSTDHQKIVTGA